MYGTSALKLTVADEGKCPLCAFAGIEDRGQIQEFDVTYWNLIVGELTVCTTCGYSDYKFFRMPFKLLFETAVLDRLSEIFRKESSDETYAAFKRVL